MFDGSVATFEQLKRPDTAIVIAITPENKFIVLEEEQPNKPKFLSIPGGRINEAEDPLVGAKRELLEETGFASEDEANFAGYLAGIGSKDRLLRYSAYNLAVEEFMFSLYFRDSLANKKLKPLISPAVHNDYKAERLYWRSYQSEINAVSGIFYDHFLKANNQPQGLDTYNRMVLLVMAMYREKVISLKSTR